jgi:predicted amidohydrolase
MSSSNSFKLAAIQAAPVYFDRESSTEKACALIEEAGAKGATIAAFGETWLPGYPFFTFAQTQPLTWKALAEYIASAVEIPSPTTDKLCAAAKSAGIDVVIGIVERDRGNRGDGVLYTALHRSRWSHSRAAPQDQAHVRRKGRLGRGRRAGPACAPKTIRADQRAQLLGAQPHASRIRVGGPGHANPCGGLAWA